MRLILSILVFMPTVVSAQLMVGGTITDSLTRAPLRNATVQLISKTSSGFLRDAESDSLGLYEIKDIPPGEYTIGFLHPLLDSLGIESPLKTVRVDQRDVRVNLAIPSPQSLRRAICGTSQIAEESALIIGTVRNPVSGASITGASITAEWFDLTLGRDGISRRLQRANAKSSDVGSFALCNVPSQGLAAISAVSGTDSTDVIEVQIPAEGFLRRDIFVGPRRSASNPRISGVVTATAGGRPLPGAVVSISGGAEARANEKGEWTIEDAPSGTRMLEVRSIGFYPERRQVDVITNAPNVNVALLTFKAVLDTVRIIAGRVDPDKLGFQQRRRSGMGRFITPEDLRTHPVINTTDLFRRIPGVYLDSAIMMRGAFELRCQAAIYIDGQHMSFLTAEDIDSWVPPKDIAGIEVYTNQVPPQFSPGLNGCGSIVIWRK